MSPKKTTPAGKTPGPAKKKRNRKAAAPDFLPGSCDEQLARDLDAMTRLQKLSTLFVRNGDLEPILGEVVEAAIAISGADFGNIQLLDPNSGDLRVAAQRGFPDWWVEFWNNAGKGRGACGAALQGGERVVVEDIELSPIFAGTPALEIQRRAGVRAVQSTPLKSRSGETVGMFSTHYKTPHRFDENTLRLLDLLARQAADIISRTQQENALRESEAKANALIKFAPTGIYEMDFRGPRLLSVNDAMCQVLGYSREELLAMSPMELLDPEGRAVFAARVQRQLAGEQLTDSVEYRIVKKDGSLLDALLDITFNIGGDPWRALVVAHDITERKRAEEALRDSRERYQALVETIGDFIWEIDPQGKFTYCSPQMKTLWGYEPERMIGKAPFSQALPQFQEQEARFYQELAKNPKPFSIEDCALDATGNAVFIEVKGAPFFDSVGKLLGFRGITRDITARKRAEEALRESEAQYRLLVDNMTAIVLHMDANAIVTFANDRALEFFGFTKEELIGKPALGTFVPERETTGRDLSVMVDEITADPDRFRSNANENIRKNGERVWVEWTNSGIYGPDGRLLGFLSVGIDGTERKRAEEALAESEERYRSIVETAKEGIATHDANGRITYVNKRMADMLGYARDEMVGKPSLDFAEEGEKESVVSTRDRIREQGSFTQERKLRRKDGSVLWTLANLAARRDSAGNYAGYLAMHTDITERKQAEQDMQRLVDSLARSNRDLQEFAYVASHDLQEPLRQVSAFIQLLQQHCGTQLNEDALAYMEFIVEGSTRMRDLIQALLTYSRVDSAGKQLEQVPVADAVDQAVFNLEFAIQENHALVTRDELPSVYADKIQLAQLFQNLIGNAIKFRATQDPAIHICAVRQDREWLFRIRDNGIGFDQTYAEKIFHLFQRLHTRSKYTGTGIGLTICKRIVERHGGRIWAESEPEKGSTFYFTLPV